MGRILPTDPEEPQMPLVWTPFEPGSLSVPDDMELVRYLGGDPPAGVEDVEVWVPAYGSAPAFEALLPRMTSLRLLQTQFAGVDAVAHLVPEGVTLCNARGVHDAATAELAVALVLASLRDLPRWFRGQQERTWDQDNDGPSLADRRVLVLGHGSIGRALERRLAGFECEVVRVARTAREGVHAVQDLPGLLPDVDVVVVLVPLSEQTRHLVDARFLAAMRDGALLVNVARGAVVDTDALLAELASGRLRAALDVTDPEPLPADHPLWTAPGTIVTPHVAGGTEAMAPRVRALVEEQLRRYVAGEDLLNVVG